MAYMAAGKSVYKKNCAGLETEIVEDIIASLISQPDIVAADKCGPSCLQLRFTGALYQIDNLPVSLAKKIPELVSKVSELSQVPF
jgi:hypothetical protein